jgi:hypothetical protein
MSPCQIALQHFPMKSVECILPSHWSWACHVTCWDQWICLCGWLELLRRAWLFFSLGPGLKENPRISQWASPHPIKHSQSTDLRACEWPSDASLWNQCGGRGGLYYTAFCSWTLTNISQQMWLLSNTLTNSTLFPLLHGEVGSLFFLLEV